MRSPSVVKMLTNVVLLIIATILLAQIIDTFLWNSLSIELTAGRYIALFIDILRKGFSYLELRCAKPGMIICGETINSSYIKLRTEDISSKCSPLAVIGCRSSGTLILMRRVDNYMLMMQIVMLIAILVLCIVLETKRRR